MATKILEETYEITQLESGIVATDVEPGDDLDEWDDLYRLQASVGISYVIHQYDTFSLYGELLKEGVGCAIADDGGSLTMETTEANEATADDMTLTPATPAVSDAYYFGYRHPFGGLTIKYSTASTDASQTVAWEYWNGSAWAAVSGLSDATNGWKAAADTRNVTWTIPNDWAKTTVNGLNYCWIRARVSAVGGTPNQATGDQAWIHPSSTEMRDTDMIKVELRDSSEGGAKLVLGPLTYNQVKEFQDKDLKAHPDIGGPVAVGEGMWLAIMVKLSQGVLDVSSSYFALSCKRVRHTLFEGNAKKSGVTNDR